MTPFAKKKKNSEKSLYLSLNFYNTEEDMKERAQEVVEEKCIKNGNTRKTYLLF